MPKYFWTLTLNGKGLEFNSNQDVKNMLKCIETAQQSKPIFNTPPKGKGGTTEKRTLRGGKKKEAPGNTKILDLEE